MTTTPDTPPEPSESRLDLAFTRLDLSEYSTEALVGAIKVLRRIGDTMDIKSHRDRERHQMLGVLAAHVAHGDPAHDATHQDPTPLDEMDATQFDSLGRLIWSAGDLVAKDPALWDVADVLWAVAGVLLDAGAEWRAEDERLQDELFGVGEFIPEDRLLAPHVNEAGDVVAGYIDANGIRHVGEVIQPQTDR